MDLLLCLLLCCAAAFSHQSEVINVVVKEDQDVLLNCALDGKNIQNDVFDWKKDSSSHQVFLYAKGSLYNNGREGQDEAFKGRVFHFPEQLVAGNASIVIRKSQVKDSGVYTCDFPDHVPIRRAQYQLVVGAAQEPVTSLKKTSDGVLLQCVIRGAFPKPRVEWRDSSGKVLPGEPKFTQRDISFDVFLQTTVTESGDYRCVATQEEIHNQVITETYVPNPGAASKPSVTILKQVDDEALLQCEVLGVSPKPEVSWKDDSGNIIKSEVKETERGGSYDVVLQATVTKTDYYHCHVTQKDINHHVSTKIHVYFGVPEAPIGWIITAVVFGALFFGLLLVVVLRRIRRRRNRG